MYTLSDVILGIWIAKVKESKLIDKNLGIDKPLQYSVNHRAKRVCYEIVIYSKPYTVLASGRISGYRNCGQIKERPKKQRFFLNFKDKTRFVFKPCAYRRMSR